MAHNIRNNSMAYANERPWHGLGQHVTSKVNAKGMIQAAKLDWTVEKRPARGASIVWPDPEDAMLFDGMKPNPEQVRYSRYEIVRMPSLATEEEIVLGIVSSRYEPLQNEDAFGFFDPIVDGKIATFETAGALGDGERIWVMAKMPDEIEVVRGDNCQKYLLLSNTHSGQGAVIVKFTSIRVVCQNTLMLALDDGQQAFRVRHTKNMTSRLGEVAELIAAANRVYERAATLFKLMAQHELNSRALGTYLNLVFPQSTSQKEKGIEPERWIRIRALLEMQEDLLMKGVRGTLWAAYNAITHFEDYRIGAKESNADRLNRVWFGDGAAVKLRALEKAINVLSVN